MRLRGLPIYAVAAGLIAVVWFLWGVYTLVQNHTHSGLNGVAEISDWLNGTHEYVQGDPVTGWDVVRFWLFFFVGLPVGGIVLVRWRLRRRRITRRCIGPAGDESSSSETLQGAGR